MSDEREPVESECEVYRAAYEQCFDNWYTQVFLQGKSQGKVGCQSEYKMYAVCTKNDLEKEGDLKHSIAKVMDPVHQERFTNNSS